MANDSRRVFNCNLPEGGSLYHEVGMWKVVLTVPEMESLVTGGDNEHGLNIESAAYQKASSLKHWYRFGLNGLADVGKDFAGTHDIFNVGGQLEEENIVSTVPLD